MVWLDWQELSPALPETRLWSWSTRMSHIRLAATPREEQMYHQHLGIAMTTLVMLHSLWPCSSKDRSTTMTSQTQIEPSSSKMSPMIDHHNWYSHQKSRSHWCHHCSTVPQIDSELECSSTISMSTTLKKWLLHSHWSLLLTSPLCSYSHLRIPESN